MYCTIDRASHSSLSCHFTSSFLPLSLYLKLSDLFITAWRLLRFSIDLTIWGHRRLIHMVISSRFPTCQSASQCKLRHSFYPPSDHIKSKQRVISLLINLTYQPRRAWTRSEPGSTTKVVIGSGRVQYLSMYLLLVGQIG